MSLKRSKLLVRVKFGKLKANVDQESNNEKDSGFIKFAAFNNLFF